ncbi:MAG: MarR family winged helix-turn-helix transcriptional regulator [Pseudomonadota bacterium]
MTDRSPPGKDVDAFRLDDFLPYRLSVVSNRVSRAIAAGYEEEFGLNISEWRALAVVAASCDMSQAEVARRTRMDKVAVSRAVRGLIDRTFVTARAHPDDGRSRLLTVTAEGRVVYDEILPRVEEAADSIFEGLTATDRDRLFDLLARVEAAVDALDGLDTLVTRDKTGDA